MIDTAESSKAIDNEKKAVYVEKLVFLLFCKKKKRKKNN